MTLTFSDRVKDRLAELPRSPLVDRGMVVDTLLDLLNTTSDPDARRCLERSLAGLPRAVTLDRVTVADVFLDLLDAEDEPSPN